MATKDPDARLDYAFDWKPLTHGRPNAKSDWLGATETITSHEIIKTPADSTVVVDATSEDDGTVTAWLTGGTAGTSVSLTCRITTNEGRTDDRSRRIDIKNR